MELVEKIGKGQQRTKAGCPIGNGNEASLSQQQHFFGSASSRLVIPTERSAVEGPAVRLSPNKRRTRELSNLCPATSNRTVSSSALHAGEGQGATKQTVR